MNGKTAKKILMRGRTRNFWGRRAYFKVRIPMSAFPEPCPPLPKFGELFGFSGSFRRVENGKTYLTNINDVSSGEDPTQKEREGKVRHLVCEEYGQGCKSYRWWEATVTVYEGDYKFTAGEGEREPIEIVELEDELADQFIAHKKWVDKYLVGYNGDTGSTVTDAFLNAGTWAKTVYPEIKGDYAYITYSVKWFYPTRRAKFANDIATAFRVAKRHKVNVRAIPAFGY